MSGKKHLNHQKGLIQLVFIPDIVDTQIDQLLQATQNSPNLAGEKIEGYREAETYLVENLCAYYRVEQQENISSLGRAWKRISGHVTQPDRID